MGGRGAFVNIDKNNFSFRESGQCYHTVGILEEIYYLVQESGKGGKKIPDYSHSPNKIYALIDNGKIKSIGIYENHNKTKSIDLLHSHINRDKGEKMNWHYHTDLYHEKPAHKLSEADIKLVNRVLKGAKKYL